MGLFLKAQISPIIIFYKKIVIFFHFIIIKGCVKIFNFNISKIKITVSLHYFYTIFHMYMFFQP
ncbi:hypothetical protein CF078_02410 [Clostridium botulinum]|uniref:Uncharacterized protein n=1 Tax=Clostridium combesii TaxID=39481 RepID=A0A2G7HK69_9CLOT|nr:hypothetical protein RSJ13_10045 [Clostridium botulinum]PIH05521.1 hypothetical protein CS538_03260 [Clostridium combesii]